MISTLRLARESCDEQNTFRHSSCGPDDSAPQAPLACTTEPLAQLLGHHVRIRLVGSDKRPAFLRVVVLVVDVGLVAEAGFVLDQALGVLEIAVDVLDGGFDALVLRARRSID